MSDDDPKVEVVRHDLAPIIRGLVTNIVEQGDVNTKRIEAQDRLWKYEVQECIWYRAVRVQDEPPRWRADSISGLPERVATLRVFGSHENHLVPDLRMRFAHELMAQKLVRDWDEARARAAKARFLCGETVR